MRVKKSHVKKSIWLSPLIESIAHNRLETLMAPLHEDIFPQRRNCLLLRHHVNISACFAEVGRAFSMHKISGRRRQTKQHYLISWFSVRNKDWNVKRKNKRTSLLCLSDDDAVEIMRFHGLYLKSTISSLEGRLRNLTA